MAGAEMDNEAQFMRWLSHNVSAAQLSELYWAFHAIELQAKKTNLIQSSLYENLDITFIRRISGEIKNNSTFKADHKRQWGRIVSALDYLLIFAQRNAEFGVSSLSLHGSTVKKDNNLNSKQFDNKKKAQYFRADKEAFYRWLLEEQHKTEAKCRSYISAIRTAEKYAKERGLTSYKLFTDNPDEARATADALFATPGFVRFNTARRNQFSAAITLLLSFYSVDKKEERRTVETPVKKEEKNFEIKNTNRSTDNEIDIFLAGDEFIPLREALSLQHITTLEELKGLKLWPFMNRYNLYSIGTRQTIFSKVNSMLYPVANLSDDQAYILHIGECLYKGGTPAEAYSQFCSDMFQRYPLQLRLLIGMRTSSGAIPIRKTEGVMPALKLANLPAYIRSDLPIDDVVSYVIWILDKCGEEIPVINVSEPKKKEGPIKPKKVEVSSIVKPINSISVEQIQPSQEPVQKRISAYVKRLEEIVLTADMQGTSYDDAKDAINATMVATKQAVADSKYIIDIKGRLFHESAFIDWEDGANQLESIICKLMQKNNGYISAAQLYEYAKVEMNMFLTDNDVNDERSVYDIAAHLFSKNNYHDKQYVFHGKHISKPGHTITSNLDIFRNYAADQGGVFSFDSLVEYLHRIGIATGNLRMQMRIPDEPIFFYYESGVLMCADNMHIDEAWINTVKEKLEALLSDVGDHIVLRMIPDIWLECLPALPGGNQWTPLLLQSVLRCYGRELGAKTIQALNGQSLDTIHTMLVANNSQIQTFGDVVVSYLFDNDVKERSFESEELRLLLVDAGILQGNELIGNIPKALSNDERFAWNASGDHVIVEV